MKLLEEREKTYGSFEELAVRKLRILAGVGGDMPTPYMAEALSMICTKLARIGNGDPKHVDSWRDIAGYATLVADLLEKDNV